ncbi:MAG: hypothetical protein LIR35_07050 [Bacteroidota bacterium]|nr:hypothetical protein [Bacteroidota bacterium]
MKRFIAVIVLAASLPAAAQNLNPTVEVQNSYIGKLIEAGKPQLEMAVPDSLTRFDLDFDYSVMETPYKGGYEFNPYLVDLKPEVAGERKPSLFFRAGAGYVLRPEVDFVYDPALKGKLSLDIYGTHRSFFGKYDQMGRPNSVLNANPWRPFESLENSTLSIEFRPDFSDKIDSFSGYDSRSSVGMSGRYLYGKGALDFNVGYFGLATKSRYAWNEQKSSMNAVDFSAGIESRGTKMTYDANFAVRAGSDRYRAGDSGPYKNLILVESKFSGSFGPSVGKYGKLTIGFEGEYNTYGGKIVDASSGFLEIIPSVSGVYKGLSYLLGVRVGTGFYGGDDVYTGDTKGQGFYPEVHLAYSVIPENLNIYADVTGGNHMSNYSDLKEWNKFFTLEYSDGFSPIAFLENTVERISATAGIRGNIVPALKFDVSAGHRILKNVLSDCWQLVYTSDWVYLFPMLGYADYNESFADAKLTWDKKPLQIDGAVRLSSFKADKDEDSYAPSGLTGNFRARYNHRDRFFAGVYGEFASARKIFNLDTYPIPGFVNLGLTAEYILTPKMSVWAKAGNILGSKIQRHPCIAESGVSLIGGIALYL